MLAPIEKRLPLILALYFVIGLVFAFFYAYFYHWTALGYFSPGFYMVILSWPYQAVGFIPDFISFGFSGKPI